MSDHLLKFTLTEHYGMRLAIECPHDHTIPADASKPWVVPECTGWETNGRGVPCICGCDECALDNHGDCCGEGYVAETGHMWCTARPSGTCWYSLAVDELGAEALSASPPITVTVPVALGGRSWDDPIEVLEVK